MNACLLAWVLAASAAPASGRAGDAEATEAVEASGQAAVGGDLLAARDRAKDEALRDCVQQVAARAVTAATEADQAQLLSGRIYARPVAYIRRFQIVDDRQDGDTWLTRVRCEVSGTKLEEDLLAAGIAHRRAGMPRALVLLAEQPIDAPRVSGWWQGGAGAGDLRVMEQAFRDRMEKSGFTFVDAQALQGAGDLEAVGADPGVQQARELGAKSGAALVVVGRAVTRGQGQVPIDTGTFHAAVAGVSARAVRVDTGEVVATVEFTGPVGRGFERASAGRNALAEAGRMLAREVFSRVGRVWTREQSGVRRLALTVTGVDDYGRLVAFKNVLVRSVRGVKEVQERSMEDGRAELDVAVSTTAQAFATELATRKFPGIGVRVGKVTDGAVEVELR